MGAIMPHMYTAHGAEPSRKDSKLECVFSPATLHMTVRPVARKSSLVATRCPTRARGGHSTIRVAEASFHVECDVAAPQLSICNNSCTGCGRRIHGKHDYARLCLHVQPSARLDA